MNLTIESELQKAFKFDSFLLLWIQPAKMLLKTLILTILNMLMTPSRCCIPPICSQRGLCQLNRAMEYLARWMSDWISERIIRHQQFCAHLWGHFMTAVVKNKMLICGWTFCRLQTQTDNLFCPKDHHVHITTGGTPIRIYCFILYHVKLWQNHIVAEHIGVCGDEDNAKLPQKSTDFTTDDLVTLVHSILFFFFRLLVTAKVLSKKRVTILHRSLFDHIVTVL